MRSTHKPLIAASGIIGGISGIALASATTTTPTRTAQAQPLPSGLLVPLYIYPTLGAWQPLIDAKSAAPSVPVAAVVNPNSGPGTTRDPNYVAGIAALRAAGILTFAYVHSSYGTRLYGDLANEILTYRSLYGAFDGLFIDEMATTTTTSAVLDTYAALTTFAKENGFGLVVGNPGTDIPSAFVGHAADIFVIYEGAGLPTVGFLNGWHVQYAKQTWASLARNVPTLDQAFVVAAKKYVGMLYVTLDPLYQSFPPYLAQLIAALAV